METSTLPSLGPDDRPVASVRVPVRPNAIVLARRTVRRAARQAGLSDDRIDDLVIAASEACTNALEAQVRAGVAAPLDVTCSTRGDHFEVWVADRGGGFEPAALPLRPPPADPNHLAVERGWGIQLMQALVDELVFDVTGPGTKVCLRMTLSSR